MATVSVTTGTVNHTLPAKFWGFNFSVGFHAEDLSNSQYRSFMTEIAPEVWRSHDFKRSNGALYSGFNSAKSFLQQVLPNAAAILNPDSGPDALPSSTNACSTTNLAPVGSGRNPAEHASLLGAWLDAGIDVQLYEFCNEPWGHCAFSGPYWYGTGGGLNADGYKCESWASIHQRDFYTPLHSAITSRGKSTEVGAHVLASSEGYGYSWTNSFINADAIQGACTSPYAGSGANLPYFDTYVFHGYPAGTSNQDRLNSLLTNQVSPPANGTSLFSKLQDTRSKLDAAGGTSKQITFDEAGISAIDSSSGLFDALYAVIASRYQAQFKIARYCLHSANTDAASSGIYPLFTTPDHVNFTRTVRSYALRDISSPYIRNYKRQCVPTITSSGTTTGTNPVQRIQASAGLNAAGTTLGVLVTNVDLTTSESITISLDVTPSGSAAVTYLLPSTGAGSMPKTTIAPSGNTFTRTIEAGAAYLFEIPMPTGGDVTPPSITDLRVANEQTINVSFDEGLDTGSVPATGDFAVTKNGGAVSVSTVSILAPPWNGVCQLGFATNTFAAGDVVNVTYTPGVNKLRDAAHNNVVAINQGAFNQLVAATPAIRRFLVNGRWGDGAGRIDGRTKISGGGGV